MSGDDGAVSNTNDPDSRPPHRSRRPLVIAAVVAVLAVAAVAAVYVSFFNKDAPERFALSDQVGTTVAAPTTVTPAAGVTVTTAATEPSVTTGAPTGTGPGSGLAGTWKVATGSSAGYRVREKLAALPAKSDAVGRSPAVTGTVKVEEAGGTLTATAAVFEVDLTKLASDESRRDQRIRTDGLQTNQFPRATFTSTRPITLPAETASGQAVKATAEGDLTLHGVTKHVSIPLDVRVTGGKGELVGSLGFPMSDFRISPPSLAGFVTVDPDATMEFKLLLEKA